MSHSTFASSQCYEVHFRSLFHEGRALVFPCDAHGRVALDALGERARQNYFYARAVVGREYALPVVVPGEAAHLSGTRWAAGSVRLASDQHLCAAVPD